jgi:membrane fusion protein, multidrug efflux system
MPVDEEPPTKKETTVPTPAERSTPAPGVSSPMNPPSVRRERRTRRLPWRGFLVTVVMLGVIGGLAAWWLYSRIEVSTDNAYVVGNITPISAEVSGTVVALFVDDNMMVQPGDPITQIDPVPFQAQVDQALSDFKQAQFDAQAAVVNVGFFQQDRRSLLDGAVAKRAEAEHGVYAADFELRTRKQILAKDKELLASLQAQKPGLEAIMVNARDYLDRFNLLAGKGDISVQDRDNREANYREAVAKLRSLQSTIAAAERQVLASELQIREAATRLEQSRKTLASAHAVVGRGQAAQLEPQVEERTAIALQNKVEQATAKLRLARLNLSYTLIRAPIPGIISRRTIQLGQTVEARKPFLSIVPLDLDNVWVVANFREEQMARVRVGQRVQLRVDGIPERTFAGWVESVAGGTGSVFSLFPPDNATGNFVRIVQRLSVRVRFQEPANYRNRIRPGMSARIVIDTMDFVRHSGQQW